VEPEGSLPCSQEPAIGPYPQLDEDGLPILKVFANILNTQLRTAHKGWSSGLRVDVGLTTPYFKWRSLLWDISQGLHLQDITGPSLKIFGTSRGCKMIQSWMLAYAYISCVYFPLILSLMKFFVCNRGSQVRELGITFIHYDFALWSAHVCSPLLAILEKHRYCSLIEYPSYMTLLLDQLVSVSASGWCVPLTFIPVPPSCFSWSRLMTF
jgi:hypothetical protein